MNEVDIGCLDCRPVRTLLVASIDASEPTTGRSRALGFAPVSCPGTAHIESAQQVQVELGSDIAGVNRTVAVTSTVRVTGTALNSSGHPLPGRVSLGVSRQSGSVAPRPRFVQIGDKGEFELADVPPGDYVLQALGDPGPGMPREFGAEYITVADHDPPTHSASRPRPAPRSTAASSARGARVSPCARK